MAKLKSSKDYPALYVRMTEEDKKIIEALVEGILKKQIEAQSPDERMPKRNAIILKALIRGLKTFK